MTHSSAGLRLRLVAGLLAGALVQLVRDCPADLVLAPWLAGPARIPQLDVAQVQGTIWNGSADVQPAGLSTLRVNWQAQWAGATGPGWRLALVPTVLPVEPAALAHLFPAAGGWLQLAQPGGRLALREGWLALGWRGVAGQASADWQQASLATAPLRPLGDFHAEARLQGTLSAPEADAEVTPILGPLQISGRAHWRRDGQTGAMQGSFHGTAHTDQPDLQAWLTLLGPATGPGQVQLDWPPGSGR